MTMHGEASHFFRGNQYTLRLLNRRTQKDAEFADAERDSGCSRTVESSPAFFAAKRPLPHCTINFPAMGGCIRQA